MKENKCRICFRKGAESWPDGSVGNGAVAKPNKLSTWDPHSGLAIKGSLIILDVILHLYAETVYHVLTFLEV